MAYMPLDKSKLYLDRTKMPKIYDLSNPWCTSGFTFPSRAVSRSLS